MYYHNAYAMKYVHIAWNDTQFAKPLLKIQHDTF